MSTNTENKSKGAPGQSEQLEAKTWDVMLDGEVIGSVHGETRERALDVIAPFKNVRLSVVVNAESRREINHFKGVT